MADRASTPFAEQIAAIERRTARLIPTERWTDIWHNAHDRAFVVAGAMKTDLLSDFATAVQRVITDGKSIQWFRDQFDEIVDRYGWAYRGERNWRTRVIYSTNMRTSYATGRLAQLRDPDLAKVAPFWMYRHGGSADPRPQHLAWDRLVIRSDSAWWKTHYPPNGWGCSCYVVAVSEDQVRRKGGRFEEPGPDLPGAIDKGWDYMPGNTVAGELREVVRQKLTRVSSAMASSLRDEATPIDVKGFAETASKIADRKVSLDLGPINNAGLVFTATGFDLTGYRRVLDNYGVRHTLKQHGNAGKEKKRGHVAVTLDDFALITTITDFPDRVFHDGKNKIGRDVLVFTKVINGIGYRHVEEIREGKKLVVTDSLRKKKGAWGN